MADSAGRAAAAALCVGPALPHHAARGCTCRASEQARLLRGRQASMARTRDSRDLAISRPLHPSIGRGLTAAAVAVAVAVVAAAAVAAAVAAVAAVAGLAPARQAGCCRAAFRPDRPHRRQAGKLARWHAGTLASTKLKHCQQHARTANRTARVAGGVRASAAGVGTARCHYGVWHYGVTTVWGHREQLDCRACLRLDHAHAQVIVLPEDATLLVACGAKVRGGTY